MNDATKLLEIERTKNPMAYPEAAALAERSAAADSESFRRRLPFKPEGAAVGEPRDNTHLYNFPAGAEEPPA